MKKFLFPILAACLVLASSFTVRYFQNWTVAEGYSIKFDGGDPSGEFGGLKGDMAFDAADLANSKFDVTIDVASINTGNGMKNTHAKSAMWLDAEKYPVIRFTSSAIAKTAAGYEATGTLDMHGVQKQVTLPFTFSNNTFKGEISVNRMDYSINTAEPNHGGSNFKISINVPVTKG